MISTFKTMTLVTMLFLLAATACADTEKGHIAYDAGNYKLAYEEFHKSAKKGDFSAQYMLGEMHYYGEGVSEDKNEAIKWYRMAGTKGNLESQMSLGYMYDYGDGVREDKSEAVRWYRLAAEQGDSEAENNLGYAFHYGEGVQKDHEEALKWYKISAHKGNTTAQTNLALLFLESDEIPKNNTEAIMWLKEAASLNNLEAQVLLGNKYELGEFLEQDLNEAIKWYRYAVEQGDIESLEAINRIREREDYVEDYSLFLRRLGITKADADALYCENFLWQETLAYKLGAHEYDNKKLDKFTDKSFKKVFSFRKKIEKKIKIEGYEHNPSYKESVTNMSEDDRVYRQNMNRKIEAGETLSLKDQITLERKEGGIFELAFNDIFLNHYNNIKEEESFALWDYCTSTHFDRSWFESDIDLGALESALDDKSIIQKVYYSSTDYGERVVDWAKTNYKTIKSLDVCDGDFDFAGGVSIGTAATSLMAGDSIMMIIGASGVYVATAPAIATGVTVAAVTGATVYTTARGYCFFYGDK